MSHVRLDEQVKADASVALATMGLSASDATREFYKSGCGCRSPDGMT